MGVYSRFAKVLEADGTAMSVRSALQIINHELDLYFTEQDGELDRDSRFCVDLYSQYAFNDMKFGEADVLARAKNTSVEKLVRREIRYAEKGVVRFLERSELPEKVKNTEDCIWLLAQQLTKAMKSGGIVSFIIDEEHKLFYYRGLKDFSETPGCLLDTCRSAQDAYEKMLVYFTEVKL
ncbi:hypothetical protein AGMMS49925_10340 [Deltaproteobacteria bacterium]|nr:hypothetical protein AGMMS49925_10340 [Deltaproteobacteria bacterium]